MASKRTLLLVGAAAAAAAALWYLSREERREGQEEEEEDLRDSVKKTIVDEARSSYSHIPVEQKKKKKIQENEKDEEEEDVVPALTPRSVKLVLDDVSSQMAAEDEAEDFRLISPRLEAFLEDGKSPRGAKSPRASSAAGRGPKAATALPVATKRTARAKVPQFDLDLGDDEDLMDEAEARAILSKNKAASSEL